MSIKEKISENVYHIYVEKYPEKVNYKVYRGDAFSFTIVGFNNDNTPFDFSIYDEINSQIRVGSPNGGVSHEFTVDEIILGKSDLGQTEYDEIHLTSGTAIDTPAYPLAWCDIEGVLNNEHKTFIKIKLSVDADVTR